MLYVVRHAHAGHKRSWTGPDDLRPLSDRGWLQADHLVEMLAPYPVTRLLTSPTVRCRQSLAPLAEVRKLPVVDEPDLDVDTPVARVLALLHRPQVDGAVLCTHGELIGALIEDLASNGAKLDGDLRWPKGSVWVLDGLDEGAVTGSLLAPVPVDD